MKKLHKYYSRGRHPKGFWGGRALQAMNGKRHAEMPEWVLSELDIAEEARILDIGCGGGANIERMLKKCPKAIATGMDLSKLALEIATDKNYKEVVDGRCVIVGGNVTQMPLAREIFDLVTAFETIYYWPSFDSCLTEIQRVLKPGGMLVIANEMDGESESDRVTEHTVGGMRIYTAQELESFLKDAGYVNINVRHDEQRRFLCVTAMKQK